MRRLLAVVVLALTACSGTTTTPQNRPTYPPSPCPAVIPAQPTMIYPTNGETGVPDGNFTLVLSFQYGTNGLILSPANGGASVTTSAPSPAPTAPEADYSVPALLPATSYTVTAKLTTTPSGIQDVQLGTFTTL
ncbi:MAG TPA: hypothetical protein VMD91_12225 [Candidatus Sulfotelmatobacter sp.]|nr:hypothetical protein [Candidatus Sulfotelmatobacter sp.]